MTVQEFLSKAALEFSSSQVACGDYREHASLLLQEALGWSSTQIVLQSHRNLLTHEIQKLESWVARRISKEPLQYICGKSWFWKSEFRVGPGVLIPRRETELIVETVLGLKPPRAEVLELGVGTANIGISVLLERPQWTWTGFEKSLQAAEYAKANIALLLPSSSNYILKAEAFESYSEPHKQADVLVSNPPYLSRAEMSELSLEVKNEPIEALFGGEDGLEFYRMLAALSHKVLKAEGKIVVEIGDKQGQDVAGIFQNSGFNQIVIKKDYAGLDRVVLAGKR